ncbi:MAG: site-specific DNA-methyltransferase [Gammaproteobacteria bacterium]|nr:site-specific DNA-methyltransferase [Gammaproteobacteria bacterium]
MTCEQYFAADSQVIFHGDFLTCDQIQEDSVDLIITSPPYNVDIHYNSNDDALLYDEYLEFTKAWLRKCFELAKLTGRLCMNIPLDKNKGGQQSVCADITSIAKEQGWRYHSTIVWNEGNISRRTAWGSWLSASAPYVIAPVEVIVVMFKEQWKKGKGKNNITRDEFISRTNGLWTFNGQSKKGAGGHPAAFPIELPTRCMKLFSHVDDVVLDPFLGSGSTLLSCLENNRCGIGVDIDSDYCSIAKNRLQIARSCLKLEYEDE